MKNIFESLFNKKIGLALGSGGAKGISHISVIQYLNSLGIEIDYISGSSIGALVGAFYLTDNLDKIKDDLLNISFYDIIKLVDPVFPKNGIVEGSKITEYLSKYIDKDLKIEDLPKPITIIATDYYSGGPVYFKTGNLLNAIRASISIPGIFTPVKNGDYLLIDGGVSNPIPVNVVKEMGADKIIAVNLHSDAIIKKPKKMIRSAVELNSEEAESENNNREGSKWYSDIINYFNSRKNSGPNILDVMSQSIDIMEIMTTQMLLKYYKPDILIEPKLKDISTLDFDKSNHILFEGYKACKEQTKMIRRKIL